MHDTTATRQTPGRPSPRRSRSRALAGCGSDEEPSTEEATTEVCDAREDLDRTLTDLGNLDPTDRSQLEDARQEISNDVDELSSAGQALAESEWDNFEQAWENLRDTVDSLDQDTTFAEAREQLSSCRRRFDQHMGRLHLQGRLLTEA